MPSISLIILMAIMFVAVVVQTAAGFGFALISVPVLDQMYGPRVTGAVVAAVGFIFVSVVGIRYLKSVNWRLMWAMTLGAWVGAPFGVYLLNVAPESYISLFIGLLVTGYSINTLFRKTVPKPFPDYLAPVFGIASGVINGAVNMGGPPLVIYLAGKELPQKTFVATLLVHYAFAGLANLFSYYHMGMFTPATGPLILWSMPPFILGALLGGRILSTTDPEKLKRMTNWLLLVLGIFATVRQIVHFAQNGF